MCFTVETCDNTAYSQRLLLKSSPYGPLDKHPFDQELDCSQPLEKQADLGTKDPPSPRPQSPIVTS
jgi:hypothetical protein